MAKAVTAKTRIQESALELFGRKGIAGTTVQEIARRANCSQAAIYKYWDSKDALAKDMFDRAYDDLLEGLEADIAVWDDPVKRISAAALGFLGYARRHPKEHGLLFQVFHSDYAKWLAALPKPSDLVTREVKGAMDSGRIPQGDPAAGAALVLGMAIRTALFERQRLIDQSPDEVDAAMGKAISSVLNAA